MRMHSAEARKSGRKTHPIRKAPLKPKNGLNGPPADRCGILVWNQLISSTTHGNSTRFRSEDYFRAGGANPAWTNHAESSRRPGPVRRGSARGAADCNYGH